MTTDDGSGLSDAEFLRHITLPHSPGTPRPCATCRTAARRLERIPGLMRLRITYDGRGRWTAEPPPAVGEEEQ